MKELNSARAAVGSLVVALAIQCVLLTMHTSGSEGIVAVVDGPPAQADSGATELTPQIVPDQRAPAEANRDRLAAESLETIIGLLADGSSYHMPGYQSNRLNEQKDFLSILSNRRSLRFLDLLKDMPEPDRRAKARLVCNQLQDLSQQTLEYVLRTYEEPDIPKNKQSLEGIKLALGTAIFALAKLGSTSDVVRELYRHDQIIDQITEQIDRGGAKYPEGLGGAVRAFARLDDIYRLTVLTYSVEHAEPPLEPLKRDMMQGVLKDLPAHPVEVVAWDAVTTVFDRSHVLRGEPIDRSRGVEVIKVYSGYGDGSPTRPEAVRKVMALCGGSL